MQLAAEIVAELEPQIVDEIHVFRPQTRRVGAKVHENGRPVGRYDFERECVTRFRKLLPRPADSAWRPAGLAALVVASRLSSIEEAGERFCALSSPELYQLLVAELGWPPGRHETWLAQLLENELLSQ